MADEKRLIDAYALIAEYDRVHIGPPGGARKLMEEAPTVDAVEVVHGQWLVEAYTADDSIVVIPYRKHQHSEPFCSRCQRLALLNCGDYVTSNYCPNCGADMRGESK